MNSTHPRFLCSFRVVSKLMYSLCHGHTHNEPFTPARIGYSERPPL